MGRLFGRKDRPVKPVPRPDARGRAQEQGFDWRSYDTVAEDYERSHAPHTRQVTADLMAAAGAGPGDRVLDIGAGTGAGTELAAEAVSPGGLAVGLEPATRMLAVAAKVRPATAMAGGTALDIPFRDDSFDAVVVAFALPYFTKLDTALFDVIRTLKPGGRLAVATWAAGQDEFTRTWRRLVEQTVGVEVLRGAIKDEAPWAEKLSVAKTLEGVLRDAGLRPVNVEKRTYRFAMSREDYVVGLETEATGRFVRKMLGPTLWDGFRTRVRTAFAEKFPEQLVDLRDALLAVGTKPAPR